MQTCFVCHQMDLSDVICIIYDVYLGFIMTTRLLMIYILKHMAIQYQYYVQKLANHNETSFIKKLECHHI